MQDDIAALQSMYGRQLRRHANNGNTVYTWSTTTGEESINGVAQGAPYRNFVLMTLWDGGGTDTYDFSNYTTDLSVDLNPGQWVILDTSPPISSAPISATTALAVPIICAWQHRQRAARSERSLPRPPRLSRTPTAARATIPSSATPSATSSPAMAATTRWAAAPAAIPPSTAPSLRLHSSTSMAAR